MPDWTFPVLFDNARVTSDVGSRSAPIAGASTNHRGIDIGGAGINGAPVVAPTDLRVTYAGQASGYGNVIYAQDAWGNQHRFAHLGGFNVSQGDTIAQGGMLGRVGSTGRSTGPHLHYEIRDKAGKVLTDTMHSVVSQGKRLAGQVVDGVLKSNPITAPFAAAADIFGFGAGDLLGGGGGCGVNPICYLQKWLEETAFVQRSALFIVALIFIVGGIGFLAIGIKPQQLAAKALA